MRKLLLSISGAMSFLIFLVLFIATDHMGKEQTAQQMAERWSEEKDVAQVSCFFSANAGISVDSIQEFEYSLDTALKEASIISESENESARLWADAYSASGKIYVSSDRASLEANAIGIGGDFFLFHPMKLITGAYFSGNDLNQDYCIIDEDAAWQLFGSNDVAGMIVYIGNIPHLVAGVVERPQGKLEEAAGLSSTLVYVSYQTLDELGRHSGINHYEIVMPNPVTNFAFNLVKERLGSNETEVEVLENTSRYSFANRVKVILDFGTRSMNGKAIIYPFWENIARGYEDIIAMLTVWMLCVFLYPLLIVTAQLFYWWKNKNWTVKYIWYYIIDKVERFIEKKRAERKKKKAAVSNLQDAKDEEEEWL